MESKIKPKHELRLNSRNKCEMTGVTKVVDADARRLRLETSEGTLIVRGDELHIRAYSDADGTLEFEGRVDALEYAAARGGARRTWTPPSASRTAARRRSSSRRISSRPRRWRA